MWFVMKEKSQSIIGFKSINEQWMMVMDLKQTTKQRKQSSIEYTVVTKRIKMSRNEACRSIAGIAE